jgi:hypothetical protein
MFECSVLVFLPLRDKESKLPLSFEVARYDFDPGLHPKDAVYVQDAAFFSTRRNGELVRSDGPRFNFDAQVVRRNKVVTSGPPSSLVLFIELEVADKEQIPEMVNSVKQVFPEYEDYVLDESN